jgi:hypothetical protein
MRFEYACAVTAEGELHERIAELLPERIAPAITGASLACAGRIRKTACSRSRWNSGNLAPICAGFEDLREGCNHKKSGAFVVVGIAE